MNSFEFIVIGGGPGGYVSAIRAAQLGMKVALIEKEHLGGVCLNWGCIPTKALLRSAEFKHIMDNSKDYGFDVNYTFDFKSIIARSRDVSKKLSAGVSHLLKKNKVTVIDGTAKLKGKGVISVESSDGKTTEYTANKIVIATGARPRVFKGLEPNYKNIITSREAMILGELPKSLIVIGSGAIGVEFASFYHTMGSEVTICEMQDRIMPLEDHDISKMAADAFTKRGIKLLTSAALKGLKDNGSSVTVTIEKDGKNTEISAEKVILAMGIECNIDNIGLENTAIKTDRGHIVVNEFCMTDEPGVYAIGDVANAPWLAHKASHEGIMVAEHAKGLECHGINREAIPACVYSIPQIASIGLTEKAALDKKIDIRIGKFPFMGNGKAIAMGEPNGLIKTIFDAKTGELLGAHMIGAEVTELIQGFGIAKTLESTEAELMKAIFPHPTLSEMMHESVLNAFGMSIHI